MGKIAPGIETIQEFMERGGDDMLPIWFSRNTFFENRMLTSFTILSVSVPERIFRGLPGIIHEDDFGFGKLFSMLRTMPQVSAPIPMFSVLNAAPRMQIFMVTLPSPARVPVPSRSSPM